MMHGSNTKITDAKQAKLCYAYKKTRLKLLKTNAALCLSCNLAKYYIRSGPDSSVGIATTGWTVRDRIPVGTRFSTRPDRPWSPPSLQ